MISKIGQRVNSALDNIVSQVVGGLFLGKFLGDYGLVISQRVFGERPGPAVQPASDLPFLAGIVVAFLLLVFASWIKQATDEVSDAVEEAAEEVEEAVDDDRDG